MEVSGKRTKIEIRVTRFILLFIVPALAGKFGSADARMFAIITSAAAFVFDLFRQRKRLLPFPIYLLLVYAVQTSWYVIGLHAASMHFSTDSVVESYVPGNVKTMTIVMAAHNEHQYMTRTLHSIYDRTPAEILKEIIVVDDGSDPPLNGSFIQDFPEVKVVRHEVRIGLIKSKTEGGNMATSDVIMFLDAHVKPEPRWAEPLLEHMNINYKRVVVPLIPILSGESWETDNNAVGVKMMFDWNLMFQWFEDYNDLVPCMSGGLFGITRQWWHESGEYDYGMAMWGAENIEQSIRIWLCGGEIYVARNSKVAHVFRSKFPYKVNNTEIYINKVRTVEAWFDEYKQQFYDADPAARYFVKAMGDISSRQELKSKLQCRPFKWYVKKFRAVFVEKLMLPREIFLIRDSRSRRCVRPSADQGHLQEVDCDTSDPLQQWSLGWQGKGLRNIGTSGCLDANAGVPEKIGTDAFMYHCFPQNDMQLWELKGGQVKWHGICLEGSPKGLLKLKPCGGFSGSITNLSSMRKFLESKADFEKYLARRTNEADI